MTHVQGEVGLDDWLMRSRMLMQLTIGKDRSSETPSRIVTDVARHFDGLELESTKELRRR